MDKNNYPIANLPDGTLEQIRTLEKTIGHEGKEVILIAYEDRKK